MDIAMPRQDGPTATRTLLATPNPPGIIVPTAFGTDQSGLRRAGAR
jgi:CheY-like chemotaxis protein